MSNLKFRTGWSLALGLRESGPFANNVDFKELLSRSMVGDI